MKITWILLLLISPVFAEEVQIDLTGTTTTGTTVTGTVDIDTSTAVLTPVYNTVNGVQYLYEMTGTFDYTNYTLSNGQANGASGTADFSMLAYGPPQSQGGPTSYQFFTDPGELMFHTSLPAFTAAQFSALNDPFATLLTDATWGNGQYSFYGGADGGGLGVDVSYVNYSGDVSVMPNAKLGAISVPEPSVLALWALGGLMLLYRRSR